MPEPLVDTSSFTVGTNDLYASSTSAPATFGANHSYCNFDPLTVAPVTVPIPRVGTTHHPNTGSSVNFPTCGGSMTAASKLYVFDKAIEVQQIKCQNDIM